MMLAIAIRIAVSGHSAFAAPPLHEAAQLNQTVPKTPVNFRQINEWAAALEQARFALVEDTRLRKSHEALNVYIFRIARPLPSESSTNYALRLKHYLNALDQAAKSTKPIRNIPLLHDVSSDNVRVWQRATQSLARLYVNVEKLRAQIRNIHTQLTSLSMQDMVDELAQTLDLDIDAFQALRDARP